MTTTTTEKMKKVDYMAKARAQQWEVSVRDLQHQEDSRSVVDHGMRLGPGSGYPGIRPRCPMPNLPGYLVSSRLCFRSAVYVKRTYSAVIENEGNGHVI